MKVMQTFKSVKSKIKITYQKYSSMRKLIVRLINVRPLSIENRWNQEGLIKKCNFALCLIKIDGDAMCEFSIACNFFYRFLLNDEFFSSIFTSSLSFCMAVGNKGISLLLCSLNRDCGFWEKFNFRPLVDNSVVSSCW